MARTQANIYLTIWADPDFRKLSTDAQWLYFTMLTHESLNYCGVMDWRPARLAAMAEDMTVARIEQAAWELGSGRFIAVDEHTEEAVVRSFVRHDGVLKYPNPTKGLVREFGGIASLLIMEIVAREVRRALEEHPDWKGAAEAQVVAKQFPEPFDLGSWNPSDWVPKRFAFGSFSEGPKNGEPFDFGSTTSTSTSTRVNNTEGGASDEATPARKSRQKKKAVPLPADWEPTEHHKALAAELHMNIDWERAQFVDKATAKGWTYKDWDAAFNNWLRNSKLYAERDGTASARAPATSDPRQQRIEARKRAGGIPIPPELFDDTNPLAWRAWQDAFLAAIGDGKTDQQATTTANQQTGR